MFYRPHSRVLTTVVGPSMTKQSFKAECDINTILRQYQKTGIINHVQSARPSYGDLPDALDYQASMNLMIEAQEAFAGLPSKVRDNYGNDPQRFLAALSDPSQKEYLTSVGVFRASEAPPAVPDPVPVPPPQN